MTTELICLNEDQTAVALRQLNDLKQAGTTLASALNAAKVFPCEVNKELAENIMKVTEFLLADICQTLGIETNGSREQEQRYADLRKANARVHDLEDLLAKSQPPEVTQAALKNMCEQLTAWWALEGFGHISELSFQAYGCTVKFNCALLGDFPLIYSETPVSDKERKAHWLDSLRERGFVLVKDERDWELLDCEENRTALCRLITGRLPSATVYRIENFRRRKADGFLIRSAEVRIANIADVARLMAS